MQILFVHPNYPAQFGPALKRLVKMPDVECVFVTRNLSGMKDGVRCIPFQQRGGATKTTHYCARTFENAVWQCHGVYEACKADADLKPDLIVGHSGFGTTAMLKELYNAPIQNRFRVDFETVFSSNAHRLEPYFIFDKHGRKCGFRAQTILRLLAPPAMPPMKIINSLPIPGVQTFEFEEQFVVTGMVTPAAVVGS